MNSEIECDNCGTIVVGSQPCPTCSFKLSSPLIGELDPERGALGSVHRAIYDTADANLALAGEIIERIQNGPKSKNIEKTKQSRQIGSEGRNTPKQLPAPIRDSEEISGPEGRGEELPDY